MIGLVAPYLQTEAARLVLAALRRSVTRTQAELRTIAAIDEPGLDTLVLINPPDAWVRRLLSWYRASPRKLIVFGSLPALLAEHLGCTMGCWPREPEVWSRSPPAPVHSWRESPAAIHYAPLSRKLGGVAQTRVLERFDFADEWNNLGFGAIRADGSIWAITAPLCVPARAELAFLAVDGQRQCSYAALFEHPTGSLLWFNRPVGPIDSHEWSLVERFVASYRGEKLPCHPVLQEMPWGYDAAITMRLDCDEDVESARALWQAYRELGVPLSLAVHTSNLADEAHHSILREIVAEGGSILSHSATHAPNWGGSYGGALVEAQRSAVALEAITGVSVRYAVSPFHQTPPYALHALADAGYRGCIGGLIRNDPEFVMARGGELADMPRGFVGHSQQCMLHGDCMLNNRDPLAAYKEAFEQAKSARIFFGYLDHPFSQRYAYGWENEERRIAAHNEFIRYIRRSGSVLYCSPDDAMDFLRFKAAVTATLSHRKMHIEPPANLQSKWRVAVEYDGNMHCLPEFGATL